MNEKLVAIVAECVRRNVYFSGSVGTHYSIQELIHSVGLTSINTLWKNAKKSLAELDSDSLFASTNTQKAKDQKFIVEALAEVFSYNQAEIAKANEAARLAQDRLVKLSALKSIRTAKEFEKLTEMTLEEIDAEIAKV